MNDDSAGRPVFIYDGDCAFCSSLARFIEKRIPTRAQVLAWQFTDIDALGLSQGEAEEAVQWVPAKESTGTGRVSVTARRSSGPEAIATLLVDAGSLWRLLGRILGLRPVLALMGPMYRWVAKNRHRMPGGTATCSLSDADRHRSGPEHS